MKRLTPTQIRTISSILLCKNKQDEVHADPYHADSWALPYVYDKKLQSQFEAQTSKRQKLIQILSPYSPTDPEVNACSVKSAQHLEQQYQATRDYCARLLNEGHAPISPIVANHDLALANDVPKDFEFWENYCLSIMERVDEVHVLCLPGWQDSIGVKAEIEYATELGLPVVYVTSK